VRADEITPVILTYNEAPNIARALAALSWAPRIVVLDSGSTDGTLDILKRHVNVSVLHRTFDNHASQWSHALAAGNIATPWVLGLDADLIPSRDFIAEVLALEPPPAVAGFEARIRYCIRGRALPRSLYPPRIILFRPERAQFVQDGHTQRLIAGNDVIKLTHAIDHDDRKPLSHWIRSQDSYARLERDKLRATPRAKLGFADRVRSWRVAAPLAVLFHCLFVKRLIFAGLPGWFYTYQRVAAEILLALYLIEDRIEEPSAEKAPERRSESAQ